MKINWVKSGKFGFLTDGRQVREIAGAWFLLDTDCVVMESFDTREAAIAAVSA